MADSSNAESSRQTLLEIAVEAGRASRDAEVEVLVKDRDSWKRLWERLDSTSEKHYENLIQDRIDAEDALTAEVGVLREQLAAAEAALAERGTK